MATSNTPRTTIPQTPSAIADDPIGTNEGVGSFTIGSDDVKFRKINDIIALAVSMAMSGQTPNMPAATSISFGSAEPAFDTQTTTLYLQAVSGGGRLWIRGSASYTKIGADFDITDYEDEINGYADARVVLLVPAWARASAPPATTGISATLHALDDAVQPAHVSGTILRKAGFVKTVQLDLSERINRTGTLYGDTDGITYGTPHAGTINGWGKGADNYRYTICGVRVAEAPEASSTLLKVLRSDLSAETVIDILRVDASGRLLFVDPSKQTHTVLLTDGLDFFVPAAGDTIVFEPYDTGQTLRIVCWAFRANGDVWRGGTILFQHDPGDGEENPAGKFSLEGIHLQHDTGGDTGNARTAIDRLFLSKHTGIVEWNELQNIFGSDLALDPPASIAGGTRKVGTGHERLTFIDETDFTGGLKKDGVDVATTEDIPVAIRGERGYTPPYIVEAYHLTAHSENPVAPPSPSSSGVTWNTGTRQFSGLAAGWGASISASYRAADHDLWISKIFYDPSANDGAGGLVGNFGTVIRGDADVGRQGIQGVPGDPGDDGATGWTARLAVVADGERRVQKIVGWFQSVDRPNTGEYISPTGHSADIANASDIRGLPGSAGAGVVAGGAKGEYLRKKSGSDFDTEWAAILSGAKKITSTGQTIAENEFAATGGNIYMAKSEQQDVDTSTDFTDTSNWLHVNAGGGGGTSSSIITATAEAQNIPINRIVRNGDDYYIALSTQSGVTTATDFTDETNWAQIDSMVLYSIIHTRSVTSGENLYVGTGYTIPTEDDGTIFRLGINAGNSTSNYTSTEMLAFPVSTVGGSSAAGGSGMDIPIRFGENVVNIRFAKTAAGELLVGTARANDTFTITVQTQDGSGRQSPAIQKGSIYGDPVFDANINITTSNTLKRVYDNSGNQFVLSSQNKWYLFTIKDDRNYIAQVIEGRVLRSLLASSEGASVSTLNSLELAELTSGHIFLGKHNFGGLMIGATSSSLDPTPLKIYEIKAPKGDKGDKGDPGVRVPAVITPTVASGAATFDLPAGKTLGDFDSIQLRFTFSSADSALDAWARKQYHTMPVQANLGAPVGEANGVVGMRGAFYYLIRFDGWNSSSSTATGLAADTTSIRITIDDGNSQDSTAAITSIEKLVLIPL